MDRATIFLGKFAQIVRGLGYQTVGKNEYAKLDDDKIFPRIEYSISGSLKSQFSMTVGFVLPSVNSIVENYLTNHLLVRSFLDKSSFTVFNSLEAVGEEFSKKFRLYPDMGDMSDDESDLYFSDMKYILERSLPIHNRLERLTDWIENNEGFPFGYHIYTIPAVLSYLGKVDILRAYIDFVRSEEWPKNYDDYLAYLESLMSPSS